MYADTIKPIAFPEVRTLSELFPVVTDYQPDKSQAWISGYCMISGASLLRAFRTVQPSAQVRQYIKARMVEMAYDTIYFEIILRADGTALVTAKNNLILSSHWLAIIPAAEVPFL